MMQARCSGCGQAVEVYHEAGRFHASACACRRPGKPQEPPGGWGDPAAVASSLAARTPSPGPAAGPPGRPWSKAVRTDCSCGRRHPSKMQALVCLNLRAEVESTGGWVLHEVPIPLPLLGPQPRSKKRKKGRWIPPGRAFTIRVDFVACWPDGRWKAVEAKDPGRIKDGWKPRAGALRTWYSRDPLFLGFEERNR